MESHETHVAQAPGSPDRAGFARAGVEAPSPVFKAPPRAAVPQCEQDVQGALASRLLELYPVGLGKLAVILGWTAAPGLGTAREPLPLEYPG